jgi:hypothetical protein
MTEDEPFLSRWSRLKRRPDEKCRAERETPSAKPGDGRAAAPDKGKAATVAKPDEPVLDLSKLPKIEDLTADSDFTAFMDARVPSGLRQAALRRAWTLDPRIRDFIEVAEFQYNWNVPGGAPGYGPLPEGVNVATLLAQVMAAVPAIPPVEDADRPALGDKLSHPAEEPASASGGEATSLSRAGPARAEVEADQKSARAGSAVDPRVERKSVGDADQDRSTAPGEALATIRRRHGGALPV